MMPGGWFKMYHKTQESPTWLALTGPGRLVLMVILMNCTYHETAVSIGGELHTLQPGQWLTSIKRIRDLAGKYITTQNVRTALASMESTHFLTQRLTEGNRRIITVNNWAFYQSNPELTKGLNDCSQGSNTILRIKKERKDLVFTENLKNLENPVFTSNNTESKPFAPTGKKLSVPVPAKIDFSFETRKFIGIEPEDLKGWQTAYPACDVKHELRKAREWLLANPSKRKSQYRRFLNSWLKRAQDSGGTRKSEPPQIEDYAN